MYLECDYDYKHCPANSKLTTIDKSAHSPSGWRQLAALIHAKSITISITHPHID